MMMMSLITNSFPIDMINCHQVCSGSKPGHSDDDDDDDNNGDDDDDDDDENDKKI